MPGFLASAGYDEVERIDLGGGYWVDIKKCLSRAEMEAAERALLRSRFNQDGSGQITPDVADYRTAMVAPSIVDWNIDDPDGKVWGLAPSQVKAKNVGRLPGPVFAQIWGVVNRLNGTPTASEQARFPGRDDSGPANGEDGAAGAVPVPA